MSEKLITDSLTPAVLDRPLRFWRMIWMGWSRMIGSGVFVVIGMLAGLERSQLGVALVLAALLSFCNGLNSIQLAASSAIESPVGEDASLDTPQADPESDLPPTNRQNSKPQIQEGQALYAYSDRRLNSWLGFTAALGLTFAQATAVATAALGASGYLLRGLGWNNPITLLPTALVALVIATGILLRDIRCSRHLQRLRMAVTLGSLLCLIVVGGVVLHTPLTPPTADLSANLQPTGFYRISVLLHTTSLLMVAYAGYSTIAQSGAQSGRTVRIDRLTPRGRRLRRILSGVLLALISGSLLLYSGIAFTTAHLLDTAPLQDVGIFVSPLFEVASLLKIPAIAPVIAVGAVVTLTSILYTLLSDLVHSLWSMGRRQDFPIVLARLTRHQVPLGAIAVASGTSAVLLMVAGDVMALWSFSTFAFLVHAAITNLAATRLPTLPYPRWVAALAGLLCLALILGLGWRVWMVGTVWLAIGLMWRGINLWVLEQSEKQD